MYPNIYVLDPVGNLTLRSNTGNYIQLGWDPPKRQDCVTEYEVCLDQLDQVNGTTHCENVTETFWYASLINIYPCTYYDINVTAYSNVSEPSPGEEIIVHTGPYQVINSCTSSNATDEIYEQPTSARTPENYLITGLEPDVYYNVLITALGEDDTASQMIERPQKTCSSEQKRDHVTRYKSQSQDFRLIGASGSANVQFITTSSALPEMFGIGEPFKSQNQPSQISAHAHLTTHALHNHNNTDISVVRCEEI
uniref:Fibronectin type-III domain-containing protein n=1 Tax=Timema cristinae TaxID=61476 RepID=A0A7R9DFB8_TIMCR|nr:unnamed protein product [Timema cristinae]